jgi:hypothetical protein
MMGVFTQKTTMSLSVYVAAVAYFDHEDTQNTVLYLANYPMVTHSVTPQIAKGASQGLACAAGIIKSR